MSSSFDFHAKLVVVTLLPIVICGALVGIGMWRKEFRGTTGTLILVVLYAVLPSVSTTVFQAFPCDVLDTGEEFLIADYSIDCTGANYRNFAAFGGLMVLVYPVGVPLLFSWLLISRRERIMNEDLEERERDEELAGIGFLFDNYKPRFWYFEIVVTVLRLMLTGVLGLIKPGSATQLSVGMIMTIFGMLLSCWYHPYDARRDNVLSTLSYVQIFLVMLCALILKSREAGDEYDRWALGFVLVLGSAMVLVVGACLAIINFQHQQSEEGENDTFFRLRIQFKSSFKNSFYSRGSGSKERGGKGKEEGNEIEMCEDFAIKEGVGRTSNHVGEANPLHVAGNKVEGQGGKKGGGQRTNDGRKGY